MDYIENLRTIGRIRAFENQNIIFFEGEMPRKLIVLLKGCVRLYKTIDNAQKSLHTLYAPCFIAEMPSLAQKPYPASAICESACEVLEVDLDEFRKNALENNAFCLSLIASLCEKIGILERLISRANQTLEKKLCAFLLENAQNLPRQRESPSNF